MKTLTQHDQLLVKPYIDAKVKNALEKIAPVETSPTANSYSEGEYLIFNDILYVVTKAIAVGDTLDPTPTTGNIEESDDIMAMLEALTTKNQAISDEIADMNNVLGAKNLLRNNASSQEINGITWTVNADGTVRAQGTATAVSALNITTTEEIPICDSYILSGCPAGGSATTYLLGWAFNAEQYGPEVTIPYNAQYKNQPVQLVVYPAAGLVDFTFSPMIRPASIKDATYEPYSKTNQKLTEDTNAIEPMLNILGAKNFQPNTKSSAVSNGITYQVNRDGTILVSGAVEAGKDYSIFRLDEITLPKGDYIFSGSPSSGSIQTYHMYLENKTDASKSVWDYGQGVKFSLTTENTLEARLVVLPASGTVNVIFKPMIRPASIVDATYVPYAKTNRELTGLLKWKRIAQITDTDTHTLDTPKRYSELLVMVYGNFSGTWRSVQFNLPIWGSDSGNGNPIDQNTHYYSGGYLNANAHTSALIQYNSDNNGTTIKMEQFESNGTLYTSGIEMAVWAR